MSAEVSSDQDKEQQDALRMSEERFRGLFENSPVSIWEEDFTAVKVRLDALRASGVRDLDAWARDHPELIEQCAEAVRVLDVNRAAVALHRATSKEQLLAGLSATFTPESLLAFRRELFAIWAGKTEMSTAAVVRTLGGEPRYVNVYYSVSPGCEATLTRVLVSLVDVTAEHLVGEALRVSERRYREVFESSADALYVLEVTTDGRFRNLDVNPAFIRSTGLTAERLLGKCVEETVDHETARIVNEKYRRCVEAGVPSHEEVVLDLPTGRRAYASTLFPIRDDEGHVYRIVGVSRDITDQRRAEEEVRMLNRGLEARVEERTAQLEAANKELESFAYSVSHDLRAPLRHIDAFVSLLKKKSAATADEQTKHYMDTIMGTAKRMGTLIDDLLSFSRMGRTEMTRAQVDLGVLVEEVRSELEPETRGRTIDWRVGELPVVSGDRAMLRVVLVNLMSNAVKFTQPCKRAEIEVGCLPEQKTEVVIFVRDNGVGFDMQYARKLYGVFERLHGVEFEGTGIGLANVRRVISRQRQDVGRGQGRRRCDLLLLASNFVSTPRDGRFAIGRQLIAVTETSIAGVRCAVRGGSSAFTKDGGNVMRAILGAMGGLLLLCGCETMTATRLPTPRARVDECEKLCSDVGMKLGAFVVMMNSAGCVCEPTEAGATTSSSGGATAAGAATIAAIEEAQRQQRQHEQQQRQSQSSSSRR